MTLLAAPSSPTAYAVSREGDDGRVVSLAPLDPFLYQENRWCEQRGELQIFVAMYEGAEGRVGICLGCGDEQVIPFSRVTEQ